MYNFSYFKSSDPGQVIRFMQEHPFAMLMGAGKNNIPVATQVPVFLDEIDGQPVLTGHIMKKTDHHKAFIENPDALIVFTGPHTYISASWYPDPAQASTWNYMSVHANGTIRFGDKDELVSILKRLTLHYENGNTASTTVFENLPVEYTERMMKAIVPFEIEINDLQHVFKLSQDRDEKRYDNIIQQLKQKDGDAKTIAAIMEKRKSKVLKEKKNNLVLFEIK